MCYLGENYYINWLENEAVQNVQEEEIWNSLTPPAKFLIVQFLHFWSTMGDSRMSLSFVMRWKTQTAKVIETAGFSQRRELPSKEEPMQAMCQVTCSTTCAQHHACKAFRNRFAYCLSLVIRAASHVFFFLFGPMQWWWAMPTVFHSRVESNNSQPSRAQYSTLVWS